ncbi:MAG: glycosyltransferase family 2 protein [Alphaproteobacteria bacterium]|nr:glycosyltransferase family 2 protein [Alphaproteobacteria bacterium]
MLYQNSSICPHVAILLCAYKGEDFIIEQLESIFAQNYVNISLWVSVDLDDSEPVNNKFYQKLINYQIDKKNEFIKMTIIVGPGKGCNQNFLSLVCNDDIQADYFAYCDQDDIWAPDKICRSVDALKDLPIDIPNLYCSRTRLVDVGGKNTGLSPLFKKKPSFANALVQNIGGGNTMLFNKAARDILKKIGNIEVVCHDWWTYLVVSSLGGIVIYDPIPTLRYRQHSNNMIGANFGWLARLLRIRLMFKGKVKKCNDINIKALEKIKSQMTLDNQNTLNKFSESRKNLIFYRLFGIYRSGVYRQTFIETLGLWAAVFLKKI